MTKQLKIVGVLLLIVGTVFLTGCTLEAGVDSNSVSTVENSKAEVVDE